MIRILEITLSWPVVFGIVIIHVLRTYKDDIKAYIHNNTSSEAMSVTPLNNSVNGSNKTEKQLGIFNNSVTATSYIPREDNRKPVNIPEENPDFEYLWLNTYGSQIELLEHLKNRKEEKLYNLSGFYEKFQNRMPEKLKNSVGSRYSFKFYLKYLIINSLISVKRDDPNNPTTQITSLGERFLDYISSHHAKSVRPL